MNPEVMLEKIVAAFLEAALAEWRDRTRRVVDYFDESGASWARKHTNLWCGAFAAWCLSKVGDYLIGGQCVALGLNPELGKYVFPSGARLNSPRKWEQAGVPQPAPIPPEEIRPGDVVVVYTGRTARKESGDHVTIATSSPDAEGNFTTIEGNSRGELGNGKRGHGVIKGQRNISEASKVWRPELEWFVGSFLEQVK